jgi:hypothetical protein
MEGPGLPTGGRRGHSVIEHGDGFFVFFGDEQNGAAKKNLFFRPSSFSWTVLECDISLRSQQVMFTANDGSIYLHGGCADPCLWKLEDSGQWQSVSVLGLRKGHCATVVDDEVLMTGGGIDGVLFDSLAVLAVSSLVVRNVFAPRVRRSAHSSCRGPGPTVFLFGGRRGKLVLGDMLKITLPGCETEMVTQQGSIPSARAGHSASSTHEFLFICGGWAGETTLNGAEIGALPIDVFRFEFASQTWSRIAVQHGVARDLHASIFWRDFLVLIGEKKKKKKLVCSFGFHFFWKGGTDPEFAYLSDVIFIQLSVLPLELLTLVELIRAGKTLLELPILEDDTTMELAKRIA